jgi:hypothetical protein
MPIPVDRILRTAEITRGIANLSFPDNVGPHGMLLIFKEYDYRKTRGAGFATPEVRIGSTIFLPLPNNIKDSFSVRVQRFDQGISGEAISNIAQAAGVSGQGGIVAGIQGVTEFMRQNIPFTGGDVVNAASDLISGGNGNINNLSASLAFLARRSLDAVGATRSVDAGLGSTLNPKAALSFDGVELKNHTFDWTFAPKNADESERLREIDKTIKRNMLPSYIGVGFGEKAIARALFKYPSMVDIAFLGIDQSYFVFFKTAMIQSYDASYTPNGVSILKGGKPAIVNLQLQVIETDIHTAENYGLAENNNISIDPILRDGQPQ